MVMMRNENEYKTRLVMKRYNGMVPKTLQLSECYRALTLFSGTQSQAPIITVTSSFSDSHT